MSETERGTERAGRRAKRFLSSSQKYEIWLQLVRQEVTIAEVARAHDGKGKAQWMPVPYRGMQYEHPEMFDRWLETAGRQQNTQAHDALYGPQGGRLAGTPKRWTACWAR
jgi:hypothetical protein